MQSAQREASSSGLRLRIQNWYGSWMISSENATARNHYHSLQLLFRIRSAINWGTSRNAIILLASIEIECTLVTHNAKSASIKRLLIFDRCDDCFSWISHENRNKKTKTRFAVFKVQLQYYVISANWIWSTAVSSLSGWRERSNANNQSERNKQNLLWLSFAIEAQMASNQFISAHNACSLAHLVHKRSTAISYESHLFAPTTSIGKQSLSVW